MSNDKSNRRPIFRIALFLVCLVLILLGFNTLYSFSNTLRQLDVIEAERDQWQRSGDILRALDLREGNNVVDLGSGAGYFSLKLAPEVGKQGQVLAVDLRKLSLFFLWTRALLKGQYNVHVVVGEEDDPRLPMGTVDAVLICNTFHEFSDPDQMLKHVYRSLRPGGRLVVADRTPHEAQARQGHEVSPADVGGELRQAGFTIVREEDDFIVRSMDDPWWLLVGRKP